MGLCLDDFGAVVACVLAEPDRFVGADLALASDVHTTDTTTVVPRARTVRQWISERCGQ